MAPNSNLIILQRLHDDGWPLPGGAVGAPGTSRVVRRRVVEAAEGAPGQREHHRRRHPGCQPHSATCLSLMMLVSEQNEIYIMGS